MNETTPTPTTKPEPLAFNIEAYVLRAMQHLASTDQSRYVICGLCIRLASPSLIHVIATDGRLLGVCRWESNNEWNGPADTEIILPLYFLKQFSKKTNRFSITLLDKGRFEVAGDHDEFRLTRKLIEGHYPSWWQVLPDKPPKAIGSMPFNPNLALNGLLL